MQAGIGRVSLLAAAFRQREAGLFRAVEYRRGVITGGEVGGNVLFAVQQGVPGQRECGGGIFGLGMGQQRPIKLHRQLAGVVVADGVAHRHHRRYTPLQQGMGGAGETRLRLEIEVFGCHLFRARFLALNGGE